MWFSKKELPVEPVVIMTAEEARCAAEKIAAKDDFKRREKVHREIEAAVKKGHKMISGAVTGLSMKDRDMDYFKDMGYAVTKKTSNFIAYGAELPYIYYEISWEK